MSAGIVTRAAGRPDKTARRTGVIFRNYLLDRAPKARASNPPTGAQVDTQGGACDVGSHDAAARRTLACRVIARAYLAPHARTRATIAERAQGPARSSRPADPADSAADPGWRFICPNK